MATDASRPGPRIDLLPELARWWDRWLRGRDNGVDGDPPVTVFVRHSTRPAPDLDEQAGVWRNEPAWPPERATELSVPLGIGSARLELRGDAEAFDVRVDLEVHEDGQPPWTRRWRRRVPRRLG
jgi:predicted acyl esterase